MNGDHEECVCLPVMRDRVIHAAVSAAADSFFAIAEALTPPDDGEDGADPVIMAMMVDMLVAEVICKISARGTEDAAVGYHANNVRRAIVAFRAKQKEGMQ